jgi:hypothetical protein
VDIAVEAHRGERDPHPRLRTALQQQIDALNAAIAGLVTAGAVTLASSMPMAVGSASQAVGTSSQAARSDHVHQLVLPQTLSDIVQYGVASRILLPTNTVLGRASAGTGAAEALACLAGGRALLGTVAALTAGYVPVTSTGGILADSVLRQASSKIGLGMPPNGSEALQVNGAISASNIIGTATGGGIYSALQAVAVNPSLSWQATGQAADAKFWDALVGADGKLLFRCVNDANSAANNWLTVTRSGYTVSTVRLDGKVGIGMFPTGSEALQVSGAISATTQIVGMQTGGGIFAGLRSVSAYPGIELNETDQVIDERSWDFFVFDGTLRGRCVKDDATAAANWLTVTRSGYAVSTVRLDGKVGIGRTPTTESLEVAGSLTLGSNANARIYHNYDTRAITFFGGTSGNGANIELYGGAHASLANYAYYDADLHTFRRQSAATTTMVLDAVNQRVGIGRTPTTYALEVAGTIYTTGGSTPGAPSSGEVLIGNGYVRADAAIRSNSFISADGGYVYAYSYLTTDGHLRIKDAVSAPSTVSGFALIYVDSADGDLKVKFGDGTVKTIVTDT